MTTIQKVIKYLAIAFGMALTISIFCLIINISSSIAKGFNVDSDLLNRSLKSQFKYADKIKAKYVLVIGDDEINENKISIKNMETGEQIKIWSNDVAEYLKQNV